MATLLSCPGISGARQSICQGFVIREDGKTSALKNKPEVPDTVETGPQLPVKDTLLHLGCRKLLGEKAQESPLSPVRHPLLQDGAYMRSAGIYVEG